MCGTLDYLPPEMVKPGKQEYGNSVDIWSVGILAFEFVTGRPPFETGSSRQTHERIRQLSFTFPDFVSLEFSRFVSICLKSESSERATLEELMAHPWITSNVFQHAFAS